MRKFTEEVYRHFHNQEIEYEGFWILLANSSKIWNTEKNLLVFVGGGSASSGGFSDGPPLQNEQLVWW